MLCYIYSLFKHLCDIFYCAVQVDGDDLQQDDDEKEDTDKINILTLRLDVSIESLWIALDPIPNQPLYCNGLQYQYRCLDVQNIAGWN